MKRMLDNPRVNFAISARDRTPGLDNLGMQAKDRAVRAAAQSRRLRRRAGRDPLLLGVDKFFLRAEMEVTCHALR